MLDPRRLRLLVQLEGLGTVRAVAAAAAMSPSAVSQQLATLERESGAALLERRGRRVALTPAGVTLAAHGREILERIEAAEEELRAEQREPAGVVRVGAFASALHAFVVGAAGRLPAGLRMHLDELEPHVAMPALERGDVDIAIVGDFGDGALPFSPDLRRTPLGGDELLAVLPPNHAAPGPAVPLRALAGDGWFLDRTDLERHVTASCRRAGFEPRLAGRLASHGSMLQAVAAGLGVTVLPAFAIDRAHAVRTCRLEPREHRELLALTRADATRRSIAVCLEALQAAAREA